MTSGKGKLHIKSETKQESATCMQPRNVMTYHPQNTKLLSSHVEIVSQESN